MREDNALLKQCHDLIWQGGKFNPIESWEQLVLFLTAKRKIIDSDKISVKLVKQKMEQIEFFECKLEDLVLEKLIHVTNSVAVDRLYNGDVREQLLGNFLRKDLGQFFTPKPAIDLIIGMIPPGEKMKIGDLCMGPGRFLTAAAKLEPSVIIYGTDISQDMVKQVKIEFNELLDIKGNFNQHDAMTPWKKIRIEGIYQDSFDRLYTNVPFGVKDYDESYIADSIVSKGQKSVPAEVLLLEKHLEALSPLGKLGIVLPDSILSNFSLRYVRDYLIDNYCIDAVISLPTHTFGHSDAVVKASILIITKKTAEPGHRVFMSKIDNIGYDTKGDVTESDLAAVLENWNLFQKEAIVPNNELGYLKVHENLRDRMTAGRPLEKKIPPEWKEISFGEITRSPIISGRTPKKSDYADTYFKLLKVRDLSPVQIDWNNPNKGLVNSRFFEKSQKGWIEEKDILIINSAHHKEYIGKNINIVENIPEQYKNQTMCAGELMIIRVDESIIDPYYVLNWLKTEQGYNEIQEAVRGQTAHLYPQDVMKIKLPLPTGKALTEIQTILDNQKDALVKITKSVEDYIETSDRFQNFWDGV